MSSNQSDSDSGTSGNDGVEYRGPGLRTNAHLGRGYGSRYARGSSSSGEFNGWQDRRTLQLYDALNYPREQELDFDTWLAFYHREGQVAGLLDKLVSNTWQGGAPPVVDDARDADDDEEDTDFERDVEALFDHNTDLDLRAPLLDRLIAADTLATLGEYAILVFGFSDDKNVSEELEEDAVADESRDGPGGLDYVEVYAEDDVDFEKVDDLNDPRHGRPEWYKVGDSRQKVHHSRVVHVAENTLTDPYHGIPFFKPIVNLIVNIQKILGASGEGYFRAGYPGIAISPPPTFKNMGTDQQPNIQKVPGTFGDKASDLERKIERSHQQFERAFATNGEITTLTPNITDPTDHMDVQWGGIAAAKNLPQSIIKGNETGERATTEDNALLRRRVGSRRNSHGETRIYRPSIDLLAYAGVTAGPEGDGYTVDWPPLSEPTAQELSERRKTDAEAIKAAAEAFGMSPVDIPEFREEFMELAPERGSEASNSEERQDEIDSRTIMDRMGMEPDTEASEAITAVTDGGTTTRSDRTNSEGSSGNGAD